MTPCTARHHDTRKAYNAGCRCPRARAAHARDEAHRRHERLHGHYRLIDPTGTVRRIRALAAIGWPARTVAAHAGYHSGEALLNLAHRSKVHTDTAAVVAAVYTRLAHTPCPSDASRRRAAAAGWLGPQWWDDQLIDDPNYDPRALPPVPVDEVAGHRAMAGDRTVRLTSAERALAVEILTARGMSTSEIADRLDVTERTVSRYRARTKTAAVRVEAGLIPFTAKHEPGLTPPGDELEAARTAATDHEEAPHAAIA